MPALQTIRLYDLRHYYVTKQLKRLQNAEFVRQIVGHKRLNTTQRYMHLLASSCKGFEGLTRRLNVTDGHIVKVKGARKTIFGTLWYQSNHMTLIRGKVRTHTVTWHGVCSYRKLKLEKADRIRRDVCPICGHELVPVEFVGKGVPDEGHERDAVFEDAYLDEKGAPRWIKKIEVKRHYE